MTDDDFWLDLLANYPHVEPEELVAILLWAGGPDFTHKLLPPGEPEGGQER